MATKNEKPQEEQIPAEEPIENAGEKSTSRQSTSNTRKGAAASAKPKKGKIVIDVEAKDAAVNDTVPVEQSIQIDLDTDSDVKTKTKKKNEGAAKQAEKEEQKSAPVETSAPTQKVDEDRPVRVDRSALVFGGGLLILGLVLMLGNLLQIPFGRFLWPFIFIIPGGLVLLAALGSDSSSGEGLSILGGILGSLGLLFLAQSMTGWWASWAYAWSLVAPTSVGVSQMLYGQAQHRDEIVKSGRRLINLGLTMFAIGFVFFELVLGVSGFGLGRLGLPVFPMILIFAGLFVLISSLRRNRHS